MKSLLNGKSKKKIDNNVDKHFENVAFRINGMKKNGNLITKIQLSF